MAIFLWIYALMSPVAGLIADRLNRKWLIVGSLFVWSGVTLSMGYSTSFNVLYILRAVMGVSEALYIPAALSLIADYHKGNTRSLAIGIHMTGLYLGQAIGGFGATVASNFSVFYFAAPSFPGWATKNWLPTLFLESLGIEMSKAGPMATITIAASSFIGVIFGGILADKWIDRNLRGRIYTGAIGLSLLIPSLIMLGLSNGVIGILGGGILFGIGFGMFDANNMPILCQFISPKHRATGYGLIIFEKIYAVTRWRNNSLNPINF
jgi:MFS family permease